MKKKILHKIAVSTVLTTMILMSGCSKKEKPTITNGGSATPTISPNHTQTPTAIPSIDTPTSEAIVTPEATVTPEVTPEILLDEKQARAKLEEEVDLSKYQADLASQVLSKDDHTYYVFIMKENHADMEPKIAVEQVTGTLYLYDADGNLSPFTKFPIDNAVVIGTGENEISVTAARELLEAMDYQKLGLQKSLSEYTIIVDEWTTIARGDNCYCFNILEPGENGALVAMYYVSLKGDAIYTFDEENGEYIRCD